MVLQALCPSSNCLYTKSKATMLRPLKGKPGYELSRSKWSNSDSSFSGFLLSNSLHSLFNPYAVWHSYFSIPRQSFHRKRAKSLEEIFSSSENAMWSILLKYQEMEMQIQAFTDEN